MSPFEVLFLFLLLRVREICRSLHPCPPTRTRTKLVGQAMKTETGTMASCAARLAATIIVATLPHAGSFASFAPLPISCRRASFSPPSCRDVLTASASHFDGDAPLAVMGAVLLAAEKQIKDWGRGVTRVHEAASAVVPFRQASVPGSVVDWQTPSLSSPRRGKRRRPAAGDSPALKRAGKRALKRAAIHSSSVACSVYFENLRADGRFEHCGLLL